MFAEVELEWTVIVQPDAMKSSAHIQRAVILALHKDFTDVKCTGKHGYHVVVTTLESIGEGRLWERRACAVFPVRFRCVVFNVFKSEHVLAVVTEVAPSGIMCRCACIEKLFISPKYLKEYEVQRMEVDGQNIPVWRSTKDGTTIKKGDTIRAKVLGTSWEPADPGFSAVGSLLGAYTGLDNRWQKASPKGRIGSSTSPKFTAASAWLDPQEDDDHGPSGWHT